MNAVFFLLVDSPASEFYVPTVQNTVSSIFIGHVDKKNNWDEIAKVYTASRVMWSGLYCTMQFIYSN